MIELIDPPYVEQHGTSRMNLSVEAMMRLHFGAGNYGAKIQLATRIMISLFNLVRIIITFLGQECPLSMKNVEKK
jgi:hypothetical protein